MTAIFLYIGIIEFFVFGKNAEHAIKEFNYYYLFIQRKIIIVYILFSDWVVWPSRA